MIRLIVFFVSLVVAAIIIGLINMLGSDPMREILLDVDEAKGNAFQLFTVQNAMWVALMFGFGELILRYLSAADEEGQLERGYLDHGNALLTDDYLRDIRRNVYQSRNREKCFLPRIILRTIDQYRTNREVDQASSILNSSLELYMHEIDLRYSMLRYVTWLIPSLGFIGTVMGIMFALQYAGVPANAEQDDFLYQVTSRLGVAFTTTLLALIMSAVLVLLQSIVQSKEETALNRAGQYCLDNLINQLGGNRTQ